MITFVIKTESDIDSIKKEIKSNADKAYGNESVVERYMDCIEEVINIPLLTEVLYKVFEAGKINKVIDEIKNQSSVEFNYEEDEGDDEDEVDNKNDGEQGPLFN